MKVLGIDPGDKRIGIAISDETGTIANPLKVIDHRSRLLDAELIQEIAAERGVCLIVVGLATDCEGKPSPQGKKAERLTEVLRSKTKLLIEMWDESNSTQIAKRASIEMGVSKKKRAGHVDDLAAAVMLQDYLDSKHYYEQ